MIIIYTILFLVYLAGIPIIYSLCARDQEFIQAFKELPPTVAWILMVACLVMWPVLTVINFVYNLMLKFKEKR